MEEKEDLYLTENSTHLKTELLEIKDTTTDELVINENNELDNNSINEHYDEESHREVIELVDQDDESHTCKEIDEPTEEIIIRNKHDLDIDETSHLTVDSIQSKDEKNKMEVDDYDMDVDSCGKVSDRMDVDSNSKGYETEEMEVDVNRTDEPEENITKDNYFKVPSLLCENSNLGVPRNSTTTLDLVSCFSASSNSVVTNPNSDIFVKDLENDRMESVSQIQVNENKVELSNKSKEENVFNNKTDVITSIQSNVNSFAFNEQTPSPLPVIESTSASEAAFTNDRETITSFNKIDEVTTETNAAQDCNTYKLSSENVSDDCGVVPSSPINSSDTLSTKSEVSELPNNETSGAELGIRSYMLRISASGDDIQGAKCNTVVHIPSSAEKTGPLLSNLTPTSDDNFTREEDTQHPDVMIPDTSKIESAEKVDENNTVSADKSDCTSCTDNSSTLVSKSEDSVLNVHHGTEEVHCVASESMSLVPSACDNVNNDGIDETSAMSHENIDDAVVSLENCDIKEADQEKLEHHVPIEPEMNCEQTSSRDVLQPDETEKDEINTAPTTHILSAIPMDTEEDSNKELILQVRQSDKKILDLEENFKALNEDVGSDIPSGHSVNETEDITDRRDISNFEEVSSVISKDSQDNTVSIDNNIQPSLVECLDKSENRTFECHAEKRSTETVISVNDNVQHIDTDQLLKETGKSEELSLGNNQFDQVTVVREPLITSESSIENQSCVQEWLKPNTGESLTTNKLSLEPENTEVQETTTSQNMLMENSSVVGETQTSSESSVENKPYNQELLELDIAESLTSDKSSLDIHLNQESENKEVQKASQNLLMENNQVVGETLANSLTENKPCNQDSLKLDIEESLVSNELPDNRFIQESNNTEVQETVTSQNLSMENNQSGAKIVREVELSVEDHSLEDSENADVQETITSQGLILENSQTEKEDVNSQELSLEENSGTAFVIGSNELSKENGQGIQELGKTDIQVASCESLLENHLEESQSTLEQKPSLENNHFKPDLQETASEETVIAQRLSLEKNQDIKTGVSENVLPLEEITSEELSQEKIQVVEELRKTDFGEEKASQELSLENQESEYSLVITNQEVSLENSLDSRRTVPVDFLPKKTQFTTNSTTLDVEAEISCGPSLRNDLIQETSEDIKESENVEEISHEPLLENHLIQKSGKIVPTEQETPEDIKESENVEEISHEPLLENHLIQKSGKIVPTEQETPEDIKESENIEEIPCESLLENHLIQESGKILLAEQETPKESLLETNLVIKESGNLNVEEISPCASLENHFIQVSENVTGEDVTSSEMKNIIKEADKTVLQEEVISEELLLEKNPVTKDSENLDIKEIISHQSSLDNYLIQKSENTQGSISTETSFEYNQVNQSSDEIVPGEAVILKDLSLEKNQIIEESGKTIIELTKKSQLENDQESRKTVTSQKSFGEIQESEMSVKEEESKPESSLESHLNQELLKPVNSGELLENNKILELEKRLGEASLESNQYNQEIEKTPTHLESTLKVNQHNQESEKTYREMVVHSESSLKSDQHNHESEVLLEETAIHLESSPKIKQHNQELKMTLGETEIHLKSSLEINQHNQESQKTLRETTTHLESSLEIDQHNQESKKTLGETATYSELPLENNKESEKIDIHEEVKKSEVSVENTQLNQGSLEMAPGEFDTFHDLPENKHMFEESEETVTISELSLESNQYNHESEKIVVGEIESSHQVSLNDSNVKSPHDLTVFDSGIQPIHQQSSEQQLDNIGVIATPEITLSPKVGMNDTSVKQPTFSEIFPEQTMSAAKMDVMNITNQDCLSKTLLENKGVDDEEFMLEDQNKESSGIDLNEHVNSIVPASTSEIKESDEAVAVEKNIDDNSSETRVRAEIEESLEELEKKLLNDINEDDQSRQNKEMTENTDGEEFISKEVEINNEKLEKDLLNDMNEDHQSLQTITTTKQNDISNEDTSELPSEEFEINKELEKELLTNINKEDDSLQGGGRVKPADNEDLVVLSSKEVEINNEELGKEILKDVNKEIDKLTDIEDTSKEVELCKEELEKQLLTDINDKDSSLQNKDMIELTDSEDTSKEAQINNKELKKELLTDINDEDPSLKSEEMAKHTDNEDISSKMEINNEELENELLTDINDEDSSLQSKEMIELTDSEDTLKVAQINNEELEKELLTDINDEDPSLQSKEMIEHTDSEHPSRVVQINNKELEKELLTDISDEDSSLQSKEMIKHTDSEDPSKEVQINNEELEKEVLTDSNDDGPGPKSVEMAKHTDNEDISSKMELNNEELEKELLTDINDENSSLQNKEMIKHTDSEDTSKEIQINNELEKELLTDINQENSSIQSEEMTKHIDSEDISKEVEICKDVLDNPTTMLSVGSSVNDFLGENICNKGAVIIPNNESSVEELENVNKNIIISGTDIVSNENNTQENLKMITSQTHLKVNVCKESTEDSSMDIVPSVGNSVLKQDLISTSSEVINLDNINHLSALMADKDINGSKLTDTSLTSKALMPQTPLDNTHATNLEIEETDSMHNQETGKNTEIIQDSLDALSEEELLKETETLDTKEDNTLTTETVLTESNDDNLENELLADDEEIDITECHKKELKNIDSVDEPSIGPDKCTDDPVIVESEIKLPSENLTQALISDSKSLKTEQTLGLAASSNVPEIISPPLSAVYDEHNTVGTSETIVKESVILNSVSSTLDSETVSVTTASIDKSSNEEKLESEIGADGSTKGSENSGDQSVNKPKDTTLEHISIENKINEKSSVLEDSSIVIIPTSTDTVEDMEQSGTCEFSDNDSNLVLRKGDTAVEEGKLMEIDDVRADDRILEDELLKDTDKNETDIILNDEMEDMLLNETAQSKEKVSTETSVMEPKQLVSLDDFLDEYSTGLTETSKEAVERTSESVVIASDILKSILTGIGQEESPSKEGTCVDETNTFNEHITESSTTNVPEDSSENLVEEGHNIVSPASDVQESKAIVNDILSEILTKVINMVSSSTLTEENMFDGSIIQATTIEATDFDNMGSTDTDDDIDNREEFDHVSSSTLNYPTENEEPSFNSDTTESSIPTSLGVSTRRSQTSLIKNIKQEKIIDLSFSIKQEIVDYQYGDTDEVDRKPILPPPHVLAMSNKTTTQQRPKRRARKPVFKEIETSTKRARPGPKPRAPPIPKPTISQAKRTAQVQKTRPAVKQKKVEILKRISTAKATAKTAPAPKPSTAKPTPSKTVPKKSVKPVASKSPAKTPTKSPIKPPTPAIKKTVNFKRKIVRVPKSMITAKKTVSPKQIKSASVVEPYSKPVTRRSAPLPTSVEPETVSPVTKRKRLRVSSPALQTDKKSKVEEKVEPPIEPVKEIVPNKVKNFKNVAKKSTTPNIDKLKTQKKSRNVALKSTTYVPKPQPICVFVDTSFGENSDIFINENDDSDEDMNLSRLKTIHAARKKYDDSYEWNRPGPSTRSESKPVGDCLVQIDRMPVIDQLFPSRSPKKVEPNICELCDPKRIFLSKCSLTEHINEEHVNRFLEPDTTMTPPQNDITISISEHADTCLGCSRKFHSKNRLIDHIKTCKQILEMSSKNNEINLPSAEKDSELSMTHVCRICNKKFLMAAGLTAHMKTHKPVKRVGKYKCINNLTCCICNSVFSHSSQLIEHMSEHDNTADIIAKTLNSIEGMKLTVELKKVESKEMSDSDDVVDDFYNNDSTSDPEWNSSKKTVRKSDRVKRKRTVKERPPGWERIKYVLTKDSDVQEVVLGKTVIITKCLKAAPAENSVNKSDKETDIDAVLDKLSSKGGLKVKKKMVEVIEKPDTSECKNTKKLDNKTEAPSFNQCNECKRTFTIRSIYDKHVSFIDKVSRLEDKTRCPVCDVVIEYSCKLGAHIDGHRPDTKGPNDPFSCKICSKVFRCENNLIRHELEHEGMLKVNCQNCGEVFPTMDLLNAHIVVCRQQSREFSCKVCDKVFSAKWRLDFHMRTDETHGTNPSMPTFYYCDQCGKAFRGMSSLKKHMDSKCGTEPTFECSQCDKKYFNPGSLATHRRTRHTTEKNYICQYCSKDFFTRNQLQRHELRHNPQLKPFSCKYPNCYKSYRQADSLKAHECEHTGVYPYTCEFCCYQFSNVKSLKLHKKSSNHWSTNESVKPDNKTEEGKEAEVWSYPNKSKLESQDEPKNLVISETASNFPENFQDQRLVTAFQVHSTQYTTLQPFSVNQLIQQTQPPVIVQSTNTPLTTYSHVMENYFVVSAHSDQGHIIN